MKRKPKLSLIINISVICLCVCAIAIGVYSVKNASLSVSGTIGFNAHDCEMLIKGTMQGYESSDNGTTTTAVTKYFSSNKASDGTALKVKDGTNGSWDLGSNLFFDDLHTTGSKQVNDIIFTFEITNDSDFYVDVIVDQDFLSEVTNGDRIFVYAPNNGETLSPKSATDGSKSVTLTVKLQLQKDSDGNYSSLGTAITFPTNKSLLNFKKTIAPSYLVEDYNKKSGSYDTLNSISFVNTINETDVEGYTKVNVSDTTYQNATDVFLYWKKDEVSSYTQDWIIYTPASRLYMPSNMKQFFSASKYEASIGSLNINMTIDTSKTTNMSGLFQGRTTTRDILKNLDTSNVTDMSSMFSGSGVDVSKNCVSNFNTSKVVNMSNMFNEAFIPDLTGFDTSSVTNMSYMFYNDHGYLSIDLSSFDTSNVVNTNSMFAECQETTTIYVGLSWNTSKVTSSTGMFSYCNSLVGAVAYDSTKTDATMANYTTGYLTLKTA